MKIFSIHTIFFLLVLFIMQACSSSSFSKRQYLSGRYVDKIKKPEKAHIIKTYDFDLQEYPLSADANNNNVVAELKEDTIPKIVSDTITKKEDNKKDEVVHDAPENISNTNNTEKVKSDDDSQKMFYDMLIKAVIKTLIAGLLCLISFLGMYVFFLIILPLILSGYTLPFIVFIAVSILLLIAKAFLVFASFKSLSEARKIADANKNIKKQRIDLCSYSSQCYYIALYFGLFIF